MLLCLIDDRPRLRLLQGEEGVEQFAFLQLLHPHQLQNQKSCQQPQDFCTGLHTYTTQTQT